MVTFQLPCLSCGQSTQFQHLIKKLDMTAQHEICQGLPREEIGQGVSIFDGTTYGEEVTRRHWTRSASCFLPLQNKVWEIQPVGKKPFLALSTGMPNRTAATGVISNRRFQKTRKKFSRWPGIGAEPAKASDAYHYITKRASPTASDKKAVPSILDQSK